MGVLHSRDRDGHALKQRFQPREHHVLCKARFACPRAATHALPRAAGRLGALRLQPDRLAAWDVAQLLSADQRLGNRVGVRIIRVVVAENVPAQTKGSAIN